MKKLTYTILALSFLLGSLHIGIKYLGAANTVRVSREGVTLAVDMANNNGAATPVAYDNSGKGNHATAINAQTCTDTHCVFDGSTDYMTGTGTGLFNSTNISIAFKFKPTTGVYDNTYNVLLDATNGSRYGVHKTADGNFNRLYILLGNVIGVIEASAYFPYWKVNQENILIISGTNGNTNVWLNGAKILNNGSTVWTAKNPTTYYVGASYTGGSKFNGSIYYFKVWNRLLTNEEVANLSKDRKAHSTTVSREKLVAYWNMDTNDINGTQYLDKSGKGNHATSTGSPTIGKGHKREAVDLNGTSQHLEYLDNDSLDFGTGNFTISSWIKIDNTALSQHATIISKGNDTEVAGDWAFQVTNDAGSNYINMRTDATDVMLGATSVTKSEWHHVAVTRSGTNSYGYLDGVLDDTTANTKNLTNAEAGHIGFRSNAYNGYFPGNIDDIRVWNRALTLKEIQGLYNSGNSITINGPTRSLLGYWSMNRESINGTSLFDASGKGYHGTIVGAGAGSVATTTAGWVNNALDFDGTNGYVQLPIGFNDSFSSTTIFSVSLAFKTDSASEQSLLGYYDYPKELKITMNNGIITAVVGASDGNVTEVSPPADAYNDNVWHHILWTYDGAGVSNLYMDNVLKDTDAGGIPDIFKSTSENMNIGALGDSVNGQGHLKFDGLIDEVRIYNHVLGTTEVANAFESFKRTYVQ